MPEYSIIVPVYNRPDEIDELLGSLLILDFKDYEVIIVEDGSSNDCKKVVNEYSDRIPVRYYFKTNSGPGPSRNYGAKKAEGKWFLFLDSDVVVPSNYLSAIHEFLQSHKNVVCFGGPDKARDDFSTIQKAINYGMTSFFTTGGIRGSKKSMEKFKPRSFNMGIQKQAFEKLNGFSSLRFGEDVDFSLRMEEEGFVTGLIENAFVYHKRRTKFRQFFKQVFNSGMARIVLNVLHPGSLKLVHLLPALFTLFHLVMIVMTLWIPDYIWWVPTGLYIIIVLLDSTISNSNIVVGFKAVVASFIQLFGYGLGFLKAAVAKYILGRDIKYAFRDTFYD